MPIEPREVWRGLRGSALAGDRRRSRQFLREMSGGLGIRQAGSRGPKTPVDIVEGERRNLVAPQAELGQEQQNRVVAPSHRGLSVAASETPQGTRPWSVKRMRECLFEEVPSFESYTCVDASVVVGWTALTRFRLRKTLKHAAGTSLMFQSQVRRRELGQPCAYSLTRERILNLRISVFVFKDMPDSVFFAGQCGLSAAGCRSVFPRREAIRFEFGKTHGEPDRRGRHPAG